MKPTDALRRCDYLLPQDDSPYIAAQKLTDPLQINKQLASLDNHIRDLYKTRSIFLHRLNQVRSPASTLPIEVLSAIFCHLATSNSTLTFLDFYSPTCLRPSFNLSSVSSHWRKAALGTPELWSYIRCGIAQDVEYNTTLISCLQHCSSYALTLHISLDLPCFDDNIEAMSSVTQAIFPIGVKEKVTSLTLHYPPPRWLQFITDLPLLRYLTLIWRHPQEEENFRLHTPSTVPASLWHLCLDGVPLFGAPILRLCQHLRTCVIRRSHDQTSYSEPLVLANLKRLTIPATHGLKTISSSENLVMPSLEYLELEQPPNQNIDISPDVIISFCRQVSATLFELTLNGYGSDLSLDMLQALFKSLPHLRKFHIVDWYGNSELDVIRALTYGENSDRETDCLPKLTTLSLGLGYRPESRIPPSHLFFDLFLDLLRSRRTSKGHVFHVDVTGCWLESMGSEMKEELKSVIKGHQIIVTNWKYRIPWL